MPSIPYDTGKVKIGRYYHPPMRKASDLSKDAYNLQSSLLRKPSPKSQSAAYIICWLALCSFMLALFTAYLP